MHKKSRKKKIVHKEAWEKIITLIPPQFLIYPESVQKLWKSSEN